MIRNLGQSTVCSWPDSSHASMAGMPGKWRCMCHTYMLFSMHHVWGHSILTALKVMFTLVTWWSYCQPHFCPAKSLVPLLCLTSIKERESDMIPPICPSLIDNSSLINCHSDGCQIVILSTFFNWYCAVFKSLQYTGLIDSFSIQWVVAWYSYFLFMLKYSWSWSLETIHVATFVLLTCPCHLLRISLFSDTKTSAGLFFTFSVSAVESAISPRSPLPEFCLVKDGV